MKVYESEKDDVVEDIVRMLEEETKQKIFTLKVLDKLEDKLDVIIVFEDKSVLKGFISVQHVDGKLACRVQGNYI